MPITLEVSVLVCGLWWPALSDTDSNTILLLVPWFCDLQLDCQELVDKGHFPEAPHPHTLFLTPYPPLQFWFQHRGDVQVPSRPRAQSPGAAVRR